MRPLSKRILCYDVGEVQSISREKVGQEKFRWIPGERNNLVTQKATNIERKEASKALIKSTKIVVLSPSSIVIKHYDFALHGKN